MLLFKKLINSNHELEQHEAERQRWFELKQREKSGMETDSVGRRCFSV